MLLFRRISTLFPFVLMGRPLRLGAFILSGRGWERHVCEMNIVALKLPYLTTYLSLECTHDGRSKALLQACE